MRTVEKYTKRSGGPLLTIHDCFMVTAPDTELIKECFKESMYEMYNKDRLRKLCDLQTEKNETKLTINLTKPVLNSIEWIVEISYYSIFTHRIELSLNELTAHL